MLAGQCLSKTYLQIKTQNTKPETSFFVSPNPVGAVSNRTGFSIDILLLQGGKGSEKPHQNPQKYPSKNPKMC
jgi:hypothetical protein